MSKWRELVKEFGVRIRLRGLELDEGGLCRVILDECTAIDFELDAEDRLHLYCVLPPSAQSQQLTLALLEENYALHRAPYSMAFGRDRDAGEMVLHLYLPPQIETLDQFDEALKAFSETACRWCEKARVFEPDPVAQPAPGSLPLYA